MQAPNRVGDFPQELSSVPILPFLRKEESNRQNAGRGRGNAVDERARMAELVPEQAGNYARNKLTQADSRAEPSNTAGTQMLWRQIGSKGSAHRPETSLM